MTELTFTAGTRATLDLRDSAGEVSIKDWDGATIKLNVDAQTAPYVLREGDTFRIKLAQGGTISLPLGLPVEVLAPLAVRVRVQRAGGETEVRSAPTARSSTAASRGEEAPRDFTEIADVMADYGKRVAQDVAKALRAGGTGVSEDMARKLEEVSGKIDETARRAAERIQGEVERVVGEAEKHGSHGRQAAERMEEKAKNIAERMARHAERRAEREAHRAERFAAHVGRRASRGRGWFAERMNDWAECAVQAGKPAAQQPKATEQERLTIMQMLRDGRISAEQAAQLLDALGG